MPTVQQELVFNESYSSIKRARPQLLSNGWLVVSLIKANSSSSDRILFLAKKTPTSSWEVLAFSDQPSTRGISVTSKGTQMFCSFVVESPLNPDYTTTFTLHFMTFDAANVSSINSQSAIMLETASTFSSPLYGFPATCLLTNDEGTEVSLVVNGSTPSYPGTNNIIYLKGTINSNKTVVWSPMEHVTKSASSSSNRYSQANLVYEGGSLVITALKEISSTYTLVAFRKTGFTVDPEVNWTVSTIYNGNANAQQYPIPIFVPSSVNKLSRGRIWLVWHGKDSVESTIYHVRLSFSDNGGLTWSAAQKLTSGAGDRYDPTITANAKNEIFILYTAYSQNVIGVRSIENKTGTWSSDASKSSTAGLMSYPVSLYDPSLDFVSPLFIYNDQTNGTSKTLVRFEGNWKSPFLVNPTSSKIGNKESRSISPYSISVADGVSVTSIIEKVNNVTVNNFLNPTELSRDFIIPKSIWDGLKYFESHVASITVANSEGVTQTQTYTFTKTLASDVALSENSKASKDGKDRINAKRNALSSKLGLPSTSTFDEIILTLDNGVVKKWKLGIIDAIWKSSSELSCEVSGLNFTPKSVIVFATAAVREFGSPFAILANDKNQFLTADFNTSTTAGGISGHLSDTVSSSYVAPFGSFSLIVLRDSSATRTVGSKVPVTWIAFE